MKIVLTNAPPAEAESMARALVTERLAACVNLVPMRSVYRWEGSLQVEPEVTMIIKVSIDRVAALRERIVALHSYTLPEILVLDVDQEASLAAYVAWVQTECTPVQDTQQD